MQKSIRIQGQYKKSSYVPYASENFSGNKILKLACQFLLKSLMGFSLQFNQSIVWLSDSLTI